MPGGAQPGAGEPFSWTLNPYMGCAHRGTFEAHGIAGRRERPIEPESRPAQLVLFP